MKILHIAPSDSKGGASLAARRLHEGLRDTGIDSRMLVVHKATDDPDIFSYASKSLYRFERAFAGIERRVIAKSQPLGAERVSTNFVRSLTIRKYLRKHADALIHIHWPGDGLLDVGLFAELALRGPFCWTFHDMWGMTGGCHYDQLCGKWKLGCRKCPQVSPLLYWAPRLSWLQKKRLWKSDRMNIICPSHWMKEEAEKSPILQYASLHYVPNPIDTEAFTAKDKRQCRETLGIPTDRSIILFGAANSVHDKRKGYAYLLDSLKRLRQSYTPRDLHLVVFGSKSSVTEIEGYPTTFLGEIRGADRLAEVYSAADVFVAPSLQDNLPNTIVEAISCGTPVVAFNVGGVSDIVVSGQTGYLAKPYNISELADFIGVCLSSERISSKARDYTLNMFSRETVIPKFKKLYSGILKASNVI